MHQPEQHGLTHHFKQTPIQRTLNRRLFEMMG